VPIGEAGESVDARQVEAGNFDERGDARPKGLGVHDAELCADRESYVKHDDGHGQATAENGDMPAAKLAPDSSHIAARVRARLAELKISESEASRRMGKTRTVLSTTLRSLDAGKSIHDDTKAQLEKLLGKPMSWILTGEEGPGVRLRDCAGWTALAALAQERFGFTDAQLALVGATTFGAPPKHMDLALVRTLADAL
jgi:transcriptional regulator with XRE-family HTH domain